MIPVIWSSQEDGRGRYNCTETLNWMFDQYDCQHFAGIPSATKGLEGAVYIVHGGRQPASIDRVSMDLDELEWAIVIVLGDEENSFPVEQLAHPRMKIWIQEPMPVRHKFCDRFILDGWTPHTRKHIVKCEKDLDWVFAGQMTHERRWACRNVLQTIDWGGVIVESKGYCQGVSIEEYYRLLCRAKIVPCPSGPMSPDSARVCEALECGCVPILDDLSPTRSEPGFWSMVLGPDHPFFVLTDWSVLPSVIREVKADWDRQILRCLAWWEFYKLDFSMWLGRDIYKLTERECTKI